MNIKYENRFLSLIHNMHQDQIMKYIYWIYLKCIQYLSKTLMQGNNSERNEALKSMYRSGVRASYFGHMQNQDFIKKSKLDFSRIQQQAEEEIDEKTFRLFPNFKRPQANFEVHRKSGKCFLEKPSFFGCFSRRKAHQMDVKNSKFSITSEGMIARFVDFDVVEANITDDQKYLTISFPKCEKNIYIEPTQEGNVTNWVQYLKEIQKSTDGKSRHRTYLPEKTIDFFKYEHILNTEFEKQANSGDIILFRSPHSAATVQRTFTNSQYDHVGVVLRNKKNQLFIYESSSLQGVGLTPWKDLVRYQWYKQTIKITWRRLNAEISPRQVQIIEAFVAKTLGKGFEISLDKLFKFKSTLQRSAEDEENKTYFCSELVARLYKELELIDSNKSSTSYYPVDFSQKNSLKFIKPGVSLSNQIIISFDK